MIFIPLAVVTALVQALLDTYTGVGTFLNTTATDPIVEGVTALLFGQLSTIIASIGVSAAVAFALARIIEGGRPDTLEAFRGTFPRAGSLGRAWVQIVVIAGLLTITVVGIPIAIFYLVRKTVVTQACVVEDLHARPALNRSSELVRRHGFRVLAIAALVNVTAFLLGPIVGVLVLFLTSSSLAVINVISSLVYAVVVPYAVHRDRAAVLRPQAAEGGGGAGWLLPPQASFPQRRIDDGAADHQAREQKQPEEQRRRDSERTVRALLVVGPRRDDEDGDDVEHFDPEPDDERARDQGLPGAPCCAGAGARAPARGLRRRARPGS